ncbi:hypothetical protein OG241_08050 [Streptomyces sp. NBC_01390]|uniref:hypothetical protein n=1 Tax=Streptomyces sp. NBC_01390 TaxID=2903850 RepID=UPI0032439224
MIGFVAAQSAREVALGVLHSVTSAATSSSTTFSSLAGPWCEVKTSPSRGVKLTSWETEP